MRWFLVTTLCVAALCSATPRRRGNRQADESEPDRRPATTMQRFRHALHFMDPKDRPSSGDDPVEVGLMIYFENVYVDRPNREIELDMYLIQKWTDPRLNFEEDDDDDDDDGEMSVVSLKMEDAKGLIWTPDVLLPTIQVHGSDIGNFGRIRIKENGEVHSMSRVQGRFRCRNLSGMNENLPVTCPVYILSAAYRSDAVLRQWREDVPSLRFSDDVKGDPNADFVLDTSEDANGTSEQDIPVPGGAPVKRLSIDLKVIRNPIVE